MDARVKFACLTTLALWLGGCAESKVMESPPPYCVPSTAMLQKPGRAINPYQVLVRADEADFFIGRGEKAVFGAQTLSAVSAFTTYTVDAQLISSPGGFGYRYRYLVEQGVTLPANP